jgi:UDP-glucuronate decarboxylase
MTHLVEMINKVLDYKIPYEVIDYPDNYPSNEPNRRCPDIQKAQKYLEYNPQVKLEDGLKRFFSWTNSNYIGEQ